MVFTFFPPPWRLYLPTVPPEAKKDQVEVEVELKEQVERDQVEVEVKVKVEVEVTNPASTKRFRRRCLGMSPGYGQGF